LDQTSVIAGALILAYIVFITVRGELTGYLQDLGIVSGETPPPSQSFLTTSQTYGQLPSVSVSVSGGGGGGGGGGTTVPGTGSQMPSGTNTSKCGPFGCPPESVPGATTGGTTQVPENPNPPSAGNPSPVPGGTGSYPGPLPMPGDGSEPPPDWQGPLPPAGEPGVGLPPVELPPFGGGDIGGGGGGGTGPVDFPGSSDETSF
jgi:hypothetical protein